MNSSGLDGLELKLIMLILDVEGHEAIAVRGLEKHPPLKAIMETKQLSEESRKVVDEWSMRHNLKGMDCGQDTCFNFVDHKSYPKEVFYGARAKVPENTYQTSQVSPAYMHYGQ